MRFLWIDIVWGLQKLGIILENKVIQKLFVDLTKWITLFDSKDNFDVENWLWKLKIHKLEVAGVISIQNSAISFRAI